VLDVAIQDASLKQEEKEQGQGSLFGGLGAADMGLGSSNGNGDGSNGARGHVTLPNIAPMSESERLTKEKEILGFYISGHPLEPYRTESELFATHTVSQLGQWTEGVMSLGVVVTAVKRQVSKRSGAEFARLTVEDFSGSSEVLVFPENWSVLSDRIRTDVPLLVRGGYSKRDQGAENPTFIIESVQRFEELRIAGQVMVAIQLSGGGKAGTGNRERGTVAVIPSRRRGILNVLAEGLGISAAARLVASRASRVASHRSSVLSRECPRHQSEGTGTEH